MWVVRAILILALIIIVVAFAYNNFGADQKVDVRLAPLFPNYVDVPVVTVVFWSFVTGAVLSLLLFVSMYVRLSVQMHTAKKRVKALESEVAILRNRPIEESAELLKGTDQMESQKKSPFASE